MPRNIIVGDVHGCLDEFQELLRKVSYVRGKDTLIQVGDLMDRGPDPAGCVRFARESGVRLVRGNHEEKHLRWRKHEIARLSLGKSTPPKNPVQGFNAVKAAQNMKLTDEDIDWLTSAPLVRHITDSMVVVHAGLEPAFALADQASAVIRVRYVHDGIRGKRGEMVSLEGFQQPANSLYWATEWRGPESVIYGHAVHSLGTPRIDRFEGGACYGIDTGCVYGGNLTAMVLIDGEDPEFIQVKAKQEYYPGWIPTTG